MIEEPEYITSIRKSLEKMKEYQHIIKDREEKRKQEYDKANEKISILIETNKKLKEYFELIDKLHKLKIELDTENSGLLYEFEQLNERRRRYTDDIETYASLEGNIQRKELQLKEKITHFRTVQLKKDFKG